MHPAAFLASSTGGRADPPHSQRRRIVCSCSYRYCPSAPHHSTQMHPLHQASCTTSWSNLEFVVSMPRCFDPPPPAATPSMQQAGSAFCLPPPPPPPQPQLFHASGSALLLRSGPPAGSGRAGRDLLLGPTRTGRPCAQAARHTHGRGHTGGGRGGITQEGCRGTCSREVWGMLMTLTSCEVWGILKTLTS